MPIKAKHNGSYKDITDLMNVDESIDYVLAKTSSSYKRVYTATRSIEDAPPTTFKSIKPGANLTDYRIYGQTSRNLFDMKTFAETCNQVYGTVNYINNTLTFTATNGVDAYVNSVYNKGAPFYVGERPSCIDVLPSTTYTISMSSAPKCYISWVNSSYEVVSAYTQIPANQKSYTFTTPSNCTKLLIRLGKEVTNIGDTFTISDIMLNTGSTALPYEPYGESVGDRTGNLFDETIYNKNVQDNMPIYVPIYVGNIDYVTCSTTCPKTITGDLDSANSRYIFILSGRVNTGAQNAENGVSYGAPRTIQPSNGYVTICYRKIEGYNVRPWEYQTMLNSGSTALPYEPYGYKVPVTVEGKNLYKISTFRDGSTSAVVSAVTFTINNNAVSISGISSAQYPSVTSQRFELISGETYSAKIFVDGSYDGKMYIIMRGGERQDGSDEVKYKRIDVGSGDTFVAKTYNSIIYVAEGTNKEFNAIVRVILIKGSMLPDTYEPYRTPVTTPIYLPEPIKMVGDEAEYIDYGEQKFVKKFYKITLNFDDMNNHELFPGWSGGTAVVEYCNKIRSLAIDNPNSYTPVQYSSISNFTAHFNVINFALWLGTSSSIGHTQSELKEIYAGQSITFILKIPDTDLDVTLPALPTLPGTNVLSVGTEVQPSKIDIAGHIKTISGGS